MSRYSRCLLFWVVSFDEDNITRRYSKCKSFYLKPNFSGETESESPISPKNKSKSVMEWAKIFRVQDSFSFYTLLAQYLKLEFKSFSRVYDFNGGHPGQRPKGAKIKKFCLKNRNYWPGQLLWTSWTGGVCPGHEPKRVIFAECFVQITDGLVRFTGRNVRFT